MCMTKKAVLSLTELLLFHLMSVVKIHHSLSMIYVMIVFHMFTYSMLMLFLLHAVSFESTSLTSDSDYQF